MSTLPATAAASTPDAIVGNLGPDALHAKLVDTGLRPGQAKLAVSSIFRGFLRDGRRWEKVFAALSSPAQEAVARLGLAASPMVVAQVAPDPDGTRRLLLRCADGAVVETVIIVATGDRVPGGKPRTTVCVSSQVGCGRGCAFCETGRLGLQRQLQPAEIVGQVRAALVSWRDRPEGTAPITNVVLMGMGEPLDNLPSVLVALDVMTHDLSLGIAARKITVSTVGVASKIGPFLHGTRANLAISLNAPDDPRRAQLMPVGKRTTLADIRDALVAHLQPGRDVLFEYILFRDFNDGPDDARSLARWLDGLPARCNLIPANPGPDPRLQQPSREQVLAFQRQLLDAGVRSMVRYPHGREIGAACGQLAGLHRRA